MAKVSANGARALVTATAVMAGRSLTDEFRYTYRYVIRSDGALLERSTGEYGSGYRKLGTISDESNRTFAWLERYLTKRGRTEITQVPN